MNTVRLRSSRWRSQRKRLSNFNRRSCPALFFLSSSFCLLLLFVFFFPSSSSSSSPSSPSSLSARSGYDPHGGGVSASVCPISAAGHAPSPSSFSSSCVSSSASSSSPSSASCSSPSSLFLSSLKMRGPKVQEPWDQPASTVLKSGGLAPSSRLSILAADRRHRTFSPITRFTSRPRVTVARLWGAA